jgi:hypothetical protein
MLHKFTYELRRQKCCLSFQGVLHYACKYSSSSAPLQGDGIGPRPAKNTSQQDGDILTLTNHTRVIQGACKGCGSLLLRASL